MKVNVTGLNPYVNRFIVLSIALDDWEEASQCRAGGRVGREGIFWPLSFSSMFSLTVKQITWWCFGLLPSWVLTRQRVMHSTNKRKSVNVNIALMGDFPFP